MHIKHMHEMIEKLTECTKSAIENNADKIGNFYIPDIVDMIKDLNEASYYAHIAKAMKEAEEEEEAEEKYMMRMLKEEHKDEYKRMRDEYGEDGERRFYDNYRHANGRFARKGTGMYMPRSSGRRGYEEPPYYRMMPDMDSSEWNRDMDRPDGRMYYSGNQHGNSGNMSQGNSGNSRYENARRGYSESKRMNTGNTPEENKENMRKLEEVINTVKEDLKEYIPYMSASEKTMAKQKIDGICKMIIE